MFLKYFFFIFVLAINFKLLAQEITPLQQLTQVEMNLFNGKFDAAGKIANQLLKNDSSNRVLNFYAGLCNTSGSPSEVSAFFAKAFGISSTAYSIPAPMMIYLGKSKILEDNKPLDINSIYKNAGFTFDFKIPYTNICFSEDSKNIVFIDATASLNKVFFVKYENEKWNTPMDISIQIASDGSYFPSCITTDGKKIYFTHYDDFESNIYETIFDGKKWKPLKKLSSNINTTYSESRAFENEGGTVLYFSSNRPGGFGGMDLYFSLKINNEWAKPTNCGARINTLLSEDYPAIINKGKNLLFSSQGIKKGVDGFEIYISSVLSESQWTEPQNPGYPFNCSEDDYSFVPLSPISRSFYNLLLNPIKNADNYLLSKDALLVTVNVVSNVGESNFYITDLSGKFSERQVVSSTLGNFSIKLAEGMYKIENEINSSRKLVKYLIIPFILSNDTITVNF